MTPLKKGFSADFNRHQLASAAGSMTYFLSGAFASSFILYFSILFQLLYTE